MRSYFTITKTSIGDYKEKGSKFLAFVYPVTSEEEIKQRLEDLRKQYYDARHHCYAWILGLDNQSWRVNDDGEPAHSAGDPILGQIKSFELTNTLVVVIRYFGGTKLGVGGLIHAYKTASEEALKGAGKKQIFEIRQLTMKFDYEMMSVAEKLISDFDMEVLHRDFQVSCKIQAILKKDDIPIFNQKTSDIYNIQFEIL